MTNTTTTDQVPTVNCEWKDEDKYGPGYWQVHPVWQGVDRPNTGGWGIASEELARRLERAILAGVVCTNPTVKVDVNGATFIHHDGHLLVSGRHLNADLKKLGF